MATTTTSSKFSLNQQDFLKGLLMAIIVPVLTIIQNSVVANSLIFNWHNIAVAAVGGFVGYLIKNFFTPSSIRVTDAPPDAVQAIKQGEAEVLITPTVATKQ